MCALPRAVKRRQVSRSPGPDEPLPTPAAPPLSARKQAAFAVIVVIGFFLLLEAALWLAGVKPIPRSRDPYVGFSSSLPLFVETKAPAGEALMETAPSKLHWFNPVSFPKRKGTRVYRIFSLGGSTTHGRPFTDELSFSGWLREYLPLADPSREWEVINAGGISYASYRISVLAEELLRYEPDLFIVYMGHNEFLERRTYGALAETPRLVTATGGLASRTRLYAAGRSLLRLFAKPPASRNADLAAEVTTILEQSVGPKQYHRDDALRRHVFDHFRHTTARLVEQARERGVEVLLVTPASNLKDCSPFKSERSPSVSPDQAARFDELLEAARAALPAERWREAAERLEQARAIDDRYAEVHYLLGRALDHLGRHAEARASFARAVEEDICPLRAPAAIGEAIRTVAADQSVALLDFEKTLLQRSPNGIPGAEHFLDHVHLHADGYGLLAREIVKALAERRIVRLSDAWNEQDIAAAGERVMARLDREAYGNSLVNLGKVLAWAGKLDEAERFAQQAREVLVKAPEANGILGHAALARGDVEAAIRHLTLAAAEEPNLAFVRLDLGTALYLRGDYEEAIDEFTAALAIDPLVEADAHNNLGLAWQALGIFDRAISEYERAIEANPDHPDARNNFGVALLRRGRHEEAIAQLEQAVALDPSNEKTWFNLGAACEAAGDHDRAAARFREALRLNPAYAEAHNSLGLNLMLAGRPAEAVPALREAIRLKPEFPEAHDNLGNALMLAGELGPAMNSFEQAARLRPNWAPPLLHMAQLLIASPDAAARDGKGAVRLAKRAAELTEYTDPEVIDVLAAAYAEAGDFERAAVAAHQVAGMYEARGNHAAARELRQRAEDYEKERR